MLPSEMTDSKSVAVNQHMEQRHKDVLFAAAHEIKHLKVLGENCSSTAGTRLYYHSLCKDSLPNSQAGELSCVHKVRLIIHTQLFWLQVGALPGSI